MEAPPKGASCVERLSGNAPPIVKRRNTELSHSCSPERWNVRGRCELTLTCKWIAYDIRWGAVG